MTYQQQISDMIDLRNYTHNLSSCETEAWPAASWLDRSVGRALDQYHRGYGFESRSGMTFFSFQFHNFLGCVHNCDDQSYPNIIHCS